MNAIVLFGTKQVRRVWNDLDQRWYFPIVDVVAALTDWVAPQGYIKDMRRRDPELAKGWGANCHLAVVRLDLTGSLF